MYVDGRKAGAVTSGTQTPFLKKAIGMAYLPADRSEPGTQFEVDVRNSGARAGDLVGVLGIGGLGHLGIQYAAKSGYRVVGIGRGPENARLAKQLGAFAYIDSKATKL